MSTELTFTIWIDAPFTDEDAGIIAGDLARDIARRTLQADVAVAAASAKEVSRDDIRKHDPEVAPSPAKTEGSELPDDSDFKPNEPEAVPSQYVPPKSDKVAELSEAADAVNAKETKEDRQEATAEIKQAFADRKAVDSSPQAVAADKAEKPKAAPRKRAPRKPKAE